MPHIVHLGIGNFHRAHQAWYTQRANILAGEDWRITGVSLKRPDMRDALKPQNFTYTLVIKGGDELQFEQMRVHDDILVALENPQAVVAKISDPDTHIITLTVTEKGYHLDIATGSLNLCSTDIADELGSGIPQTAVGYLVHGLMARKAANAKPLTIISCDNLPNNGRVLERLVREFAVATDASLSDYLDERVSFPNTMVDRIVPATDDALQQEVELALGQSDARPVSTEAFSEWVVEDRFAGPRPAWDVAGVTFVGDVVPFELRKLRLLNGPHSLMAYAGLLAGHEFVHEAVKDKNIRALVGLLMQEATATLPEDIRSTAPKYCDALFDRFENPALNHKLAQIACDGSIKLPVRIIPVLQTLGDGAGTSVAMKTLKLWATYIVQQMRTDGKIVDPNAETFRRMFTINACEVDMVVGLMETIGISATFRCI